MNAKFMKAVKAIFTAAFVCVVFCGSTIAQDITANLGGTVHDANGAVVPGATVTLRDPAKGNNVIRTATTNDEGEYTFQSLTVSTYDITVEASNFKKSITSGIKIDVGQRRTVDVTLEAGNVSETVNIEANPVAVELQTATASTLINGDQVRELAINNRNWFSLVTLAPGVTSDLDDVVNTGTNNPDTQVVNRTLVSVNGARPTQNTFTVDGADVTDRGSNLTIQAYPSVDSIQEFRVLRGLYPAEAGQSAGGQVNLITKSGTNQFHGDLFEFIRNEAFNANTVAVNSLVTPPFGRDDNGKAKRKPFRYNNWGWTIGGPVYFLKGNPSEGTLGFGKLAKTFFFYSEEMRHDTRYPSLVSTVPTTALKNGVFPVNICLAGTITSGVSTCNPGATLIAGTPISSAAALSGVAQAYVNQIWRNVPDPNQPNLGLTYPALNVAKFRQEIFKVDQSIGDKFSWYYRFENDKIPTNDADGSIGGRSGMPFVNTMDSNSPGRTHTFQGTYVVSPDIVIEARYVYAFGAIFTATTGLIAKDVSNIPVGLPYTNTRDVVPVLSVAGFNSLTGFSNYDNFSWKQGVSTNITWVRGSHEMKFGISGGTYRKNENALTGTNQGSFGTFNNTPVVLGVNQTAGSVLATGVTANNVNNAYQAWANFLLGRNTTFTQAKADYTADFRQQVLEGYAQDQWKARKNLTVYFGVRYSFFGSPIDKNGRLTNFVPELWSAAAAPQVTGVVPGLNTSTRVVGTGNFCNGLIINTQNYQTGPASFNCTPTPSPWGKHVYHAEKTNFAPRFGMAWDPLGKGKDSIRLGYGMYHDQYSASATELIIAQNPPFQETCTVVGTTLDNPVPGGSCASQAALAPSSLRGVEPMFNTPDVQQWSLDYQHQLTSKTLFTIGYYGSKGSHLIGFTEYDNLPAGVAATTQCAIGNATLQNPINGTQFCQTPGTAYTATPQILDQIRPYRGYRSLNMLESRYNSNYDSLQVSAQHRFTSSSQVNLSYTWSKSLTDNPTSYINAAPQTNASFISERGLTPLDRRHVLTVNYIYELPFYKDQKGFAGKFLGGWQTSGIVSYQTGSPYTITSASYDPGGIGFIPSIVAGGRPNLLCDPNDGAAHTVASWFNTACFSPQAATGIANVAGTEGRGVIVGPPTRKVDMTLMKNFTWGESLRLQLRLEAFNVFNITNLRLGTTPNLARNAATFGQITSFRDPRVLQFGAKFYF
jgi:Carboxypeptidase regulatory-like domain